MSDSETNEIDEPLDVALVDGAFVVTGPRGTAVALTESALRETARRFMAVLEHRPGGAPLRVLD